MEIAGVYLDAGFPGTMLERPGLQAVVREAQAGNTEALLAANRSRLFRGSWPDELRRLLVKIHAGHTMQYDPELAALLTQDWNEGACRGYVILAMASCGFKPADIQRLMAELHEVFDFTTTGEAEATIRNAPISFETFCP